ncbi:MAG: HipA domain-containing protein [Bacteroidales bacterium]|nr:HipA domain-containing protein [Bacteroidales bacterium]
MTPFTSYSSSTLRHLTGGITVSPILPFQSQEAAVSRLNENRGRISLSGAQSKYSVRIKDGKFTLTEEGEQGTFILKPMLSDFAFKADSPANEHLTMQIASKVFQIETATSALCFFENGDPAYITRRYDVAADGSKIQQEDFASLSGITAQNYGRDYKYTALSYQDIGLMIKKYLPAWRVEMVKFFDLILFNFLFSNGDAHLKNFSVLMNPDGDYRLSPAYDLIDTHIHLPDDSIFALQKGLFADGRAFPLGVGNKTFLDFGLCLELPEKVVRKELDRFCADYPALESMIQESYLSDEAKELFYQHYRTRLVSFLRC